jgi:hypothetical protein
MPYGVKNMDSYNDKRWLSKREEILKRDNYTCQNELCKTFNPSKGFVQIINPENGDLELHYYNNNYRSIYTLTSYQRNLTIDIDFGSGYWIVMPVLQVHHKRYIEGRELWDYNDNDLITLCKQCHTSLHLNEPIDFYNEYENKIKSEKTNVNDFGTGHNHNYKPWIFINIEGEEYSLTTTIKPVVKSLLMEDQMDNYEEIKEEILFMVKDLFRRYLPAYTAKSELDI